MPQRRFVLARRDKPREAEKHVAENEHRAPMIHGGQGHGAIDGYKTVRAIRKLPKLKNLPIISLTAKAMKGDREKCIEAGASDYITKPVNTEQLLSLLRVWLYR